MLGPWPKRLKMLSLMQVELDLDMNAHANARAWHGDRKARTVKQQKTIEANKKALAVADKKVQVQLSKVPWLSSFLLR